MDIEADKIEKLYKNFGILADAKDDITSHEEEYLEILDAVKGTSKEKRLASQFIVRFYKFFPNLADKGFEAELDLCEDEDVAIRKQAIKDLPLLCKDNVDQVPKIADILAQLLQAEDHSELMTVHESLISLMKLDTKGTLSGIFSQILNGEDKGRECCIKFLTKRLFPIETSLIDKSAEDLIIIQTKKVLADSTGDEFVLLMNLLGQTRLARTPIGQKELVDITAEQAELDSPFDPKNTSQIDRLIHCVYCALPYFSTLVQPNKFILYFCDEVWPKLDEVPKEIGNFKILHYELLKAFAECCSHCVLLPANRSKDVVQKVLKLLTRYTQLPSEENIDKTNFEFSYIEAAMYSLHRLGKYNVDAITKDADSYKDFKHRLQYLACNIQKYIKGLREDVKSLKNKNEAEFKKKVVSMKTLNNISAMIKDLFHMPPTFSTPITLSWKIPALTDSSSKLNSNRRKEEERNGSTGTKRHAPIAFNEKNSYGKQHRSEGRELYQPPSGKFSTKVSGYGRRSPTWNRSRRPRGAARWRYK